MMIAFRLRRDVPIGSAELARLTLNQLLAQARLARPRAEFARLERKLALDRTHGHELARDLHDSRDAERILGAPDF